MCLTGSSTPQYKERITGCYLKLRQFSALMTKRFHHHRRDLRSYLAQFIMPLLFIALAMVCTLVKPQPEDMPSITLSPQLYGPKTNMFFR